MNADISKIEKLLDGISAKVWIRSAEGEKACREGIRVFKLDDTKLKEPASPMLISLEPGKQGNICNYLGLDNWPACDYLYVRINAKDNTACIYLIEQSDLAAAFHQKMKQGAGKDFPVSEKEFEDTFKELDDLGDEISVEKKIKFKAKLVIKSIAEENRCKFAYSLAAVFKLQSLPEFAGSVPKKQVHNFAVLNIPIKHKLVWGYTATSQYNQRQIGKLDSHLGENLESYERKIYEILGGKVEGLGGGKKSSVRIGALIKGYEALIDHVHTE